MKKNFIRILCLILITIFSFGCFTACSSEEKTDIFVVTWANYDGTVLMETTMEKGSMPKYNGQIPAKPDTDEEYFVFNGWTPNLEEVTKDVTYTAKFRAYDKQSGKPSDEPEDSNLDKGIWDTDV